MRRSATRIGEWARDDDGDGVREVHDNTLEGLWTGLRNFLRPFRGVNKVYLHQYVAMFEWGYNVKRATPGLPAGPPGRRSHHHLPYMSLSGLIPTPSLIAPVQEVSIDDA